MVGKHIAVIGCCVVLYFTTQVEFAHTPAFVAFAVGESHHDTALPPVLPHDNRKKPGPDLASYSIGENLSDVLAMGSKLPPTRFISWSHKIKTVLGMPAIQQNCLTTAVYFEARSEPVLGQLAVATVILNRVKSANSTICGTVYAGASQFNACQFSFACDGKPDVVDDVVAWREALKTTKLAVANDNKTFSAILDNLATATYYHADYVDPRWSRSLNRLAKIGRHIFYSRGTKVGAIVTRKNYI